MESKFASGYFITGTGTGVGKTYISSLLVKGFSSFGSTSYMKPVQTGSTRNDNKRWNAPDFDFVKEHANPVIVSSFSDHVPYCFEPACSPHLAAELSKEIIDLNKIKAAFEKIAFQVKFTIVEGAGGILVPLSDKLFTIDLIAVLHIPVILVTTPDLGTLNHTFLTIKLLQNMKIPIAGIVMNNCENMSRNYIYNDNRQMIEKFSLPAPFLEVSYGEHKNEQIEAFCKRIRSI